MTDNERNMSRDEMALRLKIETGLRESYESERNKLKKELEIIKAAFKDNFNEMCAKYRELDKKYEDLQMRQNTCADTWVKYEDRIDTLNGTLEAKNEEIGRLREKVANQKTQLIETQQALADKNIKIEELKKKVEETRVVYLPNFYSSNIKVKDEEIKTLRKKNLDLKNENEGWKLKYDQAFLNKNREVTALKDEIEALKDALHDDEVEIHKLKEERDYYVADIDLYEKDVTELRAKVSSLEAYKNDYYRVLNTYNDRIEELNCEVDRLNKEKEKLKEINKKLQDDYDSLKLTCGLMKLNPGYFTPPTQPINIENLNVTYYENGPVWTSEEEETEDDN